MRDRRHADQMPPPWPPGTSVRIRERTWRVQRVRRHRSIIRLDVENRTGRRTFLVPFDRPASVGRGMRLCRTRPRQALARLAGLAAHAERIRSLSSVIAGRLAILPFQLEPALTMLAGARRLLLADEVGLGKTIQAGIVIAEIRRREIPARVLLIVPAPVRSQWIDELATRFGLECVAADRSGLDEAAREGGRNESPWCRAAIWIASIDFIKQPHVLDAMPPAPWDLVVFDEAHAICGDSERHRAAGALARRARRLLLLTATPHAGDDDRFNRLLALGTLSGTADTLAIMRRTRAHLSLPATRRVRWHFVRLSEAEHQVLQVLRDYEQAVLKHADAQGRDAALLLLSVFRKRALSTMHALAISIERRLDWRLDRLAAADWYQPPLNFDPAVMAGEDDLADAERHSLGVDVGMNRRLELAWLRRISGLAQRASRHERKIATVARLLGRTREPIIVFTEFRHSLHALYRRLSGIRELAVLHGGQSTTQASSELERFTRGHASVLLATDVAAQGLNLQTRSRWVISFELPWNPMRLEQRVGRVDRIGQQRAPRLTVLIARHEAEAGLLTHLARRAVAARRALGDDVLPAAPDEKRVRAALLGPEAASARQARDSLQPGFERSPVPLCRAFVRHARVEARRLIRLRTFARRWRAPVDRLPRMRSTTAHWPLLRDRDSTLFVMAVPLVDQLGAVIEQVIVALAVAEPFDAIRQRHDGVKELFRIAAGASIRRAARISRLLTARAACDIALEQTIAAGLIRECTVVDQPGLFDHRAERARADADVVREQIQAQLRDRIAQLECRAMVRPGEPHLAFVLTPRR